MKRLNLLSGILMAIAMTLSFSACSDNNDPAPTPDQTRNRNFPIITLIFL